MSATRLNQQNGSLVCKEGSQPQPQPQPQQPMPLEEAWGTAVSSLQGKSYWQIKNATSKKGTPKELWHPNGYAVKFYLDLGDLYIDRDENTRFVKYAASRQDPGALLPPELALNEVCPSRPPRHFNTASNFLYSDPEDDGTANQEEDEYYEVNTRGHLLQEEKQASSKSGGSGVQALSVTAGSPTFLRFIKHVERVNQDRLGDHYICLSCWCFIDIDQQQVHQRCQHVCASVGTIRDEETFLRQAATFNRFNIGSQTVQIFRKYSKTLIEKIGVIKCHTRVDFMKHYKKVIRKEVCHMKGAPPLLGKPLVPADMIPFNDPKIFKASEALQYKFMAHEIRSMPTMRENRQANRDILFSQVLGDVMECFGDCVEEMTFEVAEMRQSMEGVVSWLHPEEISKIRHQREIRQAEYEQAQAELAEDLEMLPNSHQQNFDLNPLLAYKEDENDQQRRGSFRTLGNCKKQREVVKQQRQQMTEERAKIRAENKAIRADTERLKQIKRDRKRQAKLGIEGNDLDSIGFTGASIFMEHSSLEKSAVVEEPLRVTLEPRITNGNPFLIAEESHMSEMMSFDPAMIPDRGKAQAAAMPTVREPKPLTHHQQLPFATDKMPRRKNFATPLRPPIKVSDNLSLKRAKTKFKFGTGDKLDLGGLFSDSSMQSWDSNYLSRTVQVPPVQELSVSQQNLKRATARSPQANKAWVQEQQTYQLQQFQQHSTMVQMGDQRSVEDARDSLAETLKKKRSYLDKKVEKAQKTIDMLKTGTFFDLT